MDVLTWLHNALESLFDDTKGAISIMFGFTLLLMFGAAGLGLDLLRAQRAGSRAASSLDAAALAAARAMNENDNRTDAELIDLAMQVFQVNVANFSSDGVTWSPPAFTIDRTNFTIEIDTAISVETTLAKVAGVSSVTANRRSKVVYAPRRIELAMVLDVTGSMADSGKISSMKNAARDVLDILLDPNKPSQTRIALVPYSAAVNVGGIASFVSSGASTDGCVIERLDAAARDTDEVADAGAPFAALGQLNSGTNSRYSCPTSTLVPLSGSLNELRNEINTYSPIGATAGHIGLAWGWNAISPAWSGVFTGTSAPGPYSDNRYIKAILLMTDGLFNTSYTSAVDDAAQTAESIARTNALCTNIKASGVVIFAVALDMEPSAEALLQSCASSSAHFFSTNNESELRGAFQSIAGQLNNLRIAQ